MVVSVYVCHSVSMLVMWIHLSNHRSQGPAYRSVLDRQVDSVIMYFTRYQALFIIRLCYINVGFIEAFCVVFPSDYTG